MNLTVIGSGYVGLVSGTCFDKIKRQLNYPVIFDGRNQYIAYDLGNKGIEYYRVGKSNNEYFSNRNKRGYRLFFLKIRLFYR
ncbi:MAG: hypothetical protein ACWIPJ_07090 [Polaribacter sp.]